MSLNECNIILDKREGFRSSWIDSYCETIRQVYPDSPESKIREYVEGLFDKRFKDVPCIIYNNYEKESINTTLSKVFGLIQKTQPLISESGTLFKQHADEWNPDSEILQMNLKKRKESKGKMFQYEDELTRLQDKHKQSGEPDTEEYLTKVKKLQFYVTFYDRDQRRRKIIVNSYYGSSGLASSRFYNLACATSTTARGQALISTARGAQEDFLADNVAFLDMDECIRFIRLTCCEASTRKCKDSEWITPVSVDKVLKRLKRKFYPGVKIEEELIMKFISRLGQEDLNRIYYKSNLEEFFLNSTKAIKIINKIASTKVSFLESDNPPKEFASDLMELKNAVLEYVHFCHPIIERINRLKFHERKRVRTID